MTYTSANDLTRLSRIQRLLLVVVGGTLLSLLATAVWLRPDPQGIGTHQQLGLPPCTFRVLFQTRCPACGMTTSWAHVVRGQLLSACRANLGGTLLALLAVVAGPWSLCSAIRGRFACRPPAGWALLLVILAIVVVTLLDWTGRLIVRQWSEHGSAFSIQATDGDGRDGSLAGNDGPRLRQLRVDGWHHVRRVPSGRGV